MTEQTPLRRPTALITGASSGIGEALAHCFARGGHDLVLVARSAGKLGALARELAASHGVKAWAVPCDLAQPGAAAELAAKLKRQRRTIDILVNNAGVLEFGAFIEQDASRHGELIGLNILALTELIAQFVPAMVKRGQGKVLNVASVAAFQPVPMLVTYAATKAYVLSLTESLSQELDGKGVTVTALCPGITATRMLEAAQGGNNALARLPGFMVGRVEDVAAEGYAACMAGEVIRVPGLINRATTIAGRATPKWLSRRLSGAMLRALK